MRMSLLAERSSRSAWNARAAVVRCSGARVFRTPSHVKASFTAAIVVRSLWAALGEVCVAGLLVGEVVVRLAVCWPVSVEVVVAVDMGTCGFLEGWMKGPAAETGSGMGWENPLAGDAFWMLGSPISHGGDHGAACHHEPESGAKNLGQVAGFYRAEGMPRGIPHR